MSSLQHMSRQLIRCTSASSRKLPAAATPQKSCLVWKKKDPQAQKNPGWMAQKQGTGSSFREKKIVQDKREEEKNSGGLSGPFLPVRREGEGGRPKCRP